MKILDLKDAMEHFDTLAEHHQAEWAHLNDGETIEGRKTRMLEYLKEEFVPSIFIAVESSRLMGSAAIVECDMDTKPELTPWLASVYVLPEYRRKGIATKLIKHVMKQAEINNLPKMYLFTEDAGDVYSKIGWKVISREIYKNESVTVMEKKINFMPMNFLERSGREKLKLS